MGWWKRAKQLWSLRGSRGPVKVAGEVSIQGRVIVRGGGRVEIQEGVRLEALQAPIVLTAFSDAEIIIGTGALIESGAYIEACSSIRIGAGARIGAFAMILDNHFHPLEGDRSVSPDSHAIVVGEGADIGPRAILLPGADIGSRTWVAPCSVISRHTPPDSVAQGNPATLGRRP